MITQFHLLFAASVSHTYYSGACNDFDFIIPADTARLLKNGKLITKVRDGKLYVLFEADEADAALVPMAGKTMRIGLKLRNPFFSNFTDFGFDFGSSLPLYRNSTTPAVLDAFDETALVGQVFSHSLTETGRPVTVSLKNADGQVLQTDTITATNDRLAVSYDLAGQAAGAYTIEEAYTGSTETVSYYSDAELQREGIFGVVDIKIDSSFYTAAPEFEIAFTAKQETLKYYVVANNYTDTEFNQLSVADNGFIEDGRPQVSFAKVAAAAFTANELAPALLGDSNAKVVLFKSQALVARQKKALKKIQLNKNSDVLITHLPQPGPDKANADLIIQIAKP